MNVKQCANCLLHGWKQLEKEDDLLTCKRCKVIKYCGKDCQTEHWNKLHKRQCKYLANPAKAQQTKHNEDTCVSCLRTAGVSECDIREARNPNYECFYKSQEWGKLVASDLYHDHTFPLQTGNIKERVGIVLWSLVNKFQHSQPTVFQKFPDELKEILDVLLMQRLRIWQNRKIYPQPECFQTDEDAVFIDPDVYFKIERCISLADPFELWKTVNVVHKIGVDQSIKRTLNSFKEPLATLPNDIRSLVFMALTNTAKFTAIANQVLEALAYQVIPYQEVLKIVCGGSLQQTCSLCSKEIIITGFGFLAKDGPVVFFDHLFMGMFVCGVGDCHVGMHSMIDDIAKFFNVVMFASMERKATRCDYCFLLSPANDVHRCSRCCTTMYCSKTCQHEDWKVHKEVCKEEEEERKIKFGDVERREEAREARKEFKETCVGLMSGREIRGLDEACEMLEHFEFKKAQKKFKKKTK